MPGGEKAILEDSVPELVDRTHITQKPEAVGIVEEGSQLARELPAYRETYGCHLEEHPCVLVPAGGPRNEC